MANVAFNVIIIMVICVRRRKFYTPEANTLYDRSVSDKGHPHARTHAHRRERKVDEEWYVSYDFGSFCLL